VLSVVALVLAETLVSGGVSAGVFVPVAALAVPTGATLVVVLVLAGALAVAEVFVSAVTLLLVVAQPLRKNPRSNDNRIEGLTVRVMFELIKIYG
jgi:hypothetical protein